MPDRRLGVKTSRAAGVQERDRSETTPFRGEVMKTRDQRVVEVECDSHEARSGGILKGHQVASACLIACLCRERFYRSHGPQSGADTEMPQPSIMGDLAAVIADRRAHPPAEGSYVVQLLQAGARKIRVKVVEEAAEVFEAAVETGPEGRFHLVKEVADLIFHSLVLLENRDIAWSEVEPSSPGDSASAESTKRPRVFKTYNVSFDMKRMSSRMFPIDTFARHWVVALRRQVR